MFEDWKQAWRQAVENFQREIADGEAGAPPRVKAMERELASAAGALLRLDDEIRRTRREIETELQAEEVCRRRERLAREVLDEETVRIAVEFAVRHAERAAVLQRKVSVFEDERALLARDVAEMRRVIAQAPQARAGVHAGPDDGSTGAGGAASSAEDGRAAPPDPADEERSTRDFSRLERDARERAAAERLEELKRRMGATD
jgi:hypothetical protein